MAAEKTLNKRQTPEELETSPSVAFIRKTLVWWLPLLYLLISDSFYLRTYDSAQVKITLVQMGGVTLLVLWLCKLADEGLQIFRKDDLVCIAPVLFYLLSGIFSFIHTPYQGPGLDEFLRRCFYMMAAMIVIREFDSEAIAWLTRVLLWTTTIAVLYGFIQWLDSFFPGGIGNGLDPFIWRGAFSERVFSTFGNPNFYGDFLCITAPLLAAQYLKTRYFPLIPVFLMLLWTLFKTETKGAWLGFLCESVAFVVVYAIFFTRWDKKALLRRVAVISAVLILGGGSVTMYYVFKRMTSVNFRLFTWEATWEMIQTSPWVGMGVGCFKVIYPAFRRPPIFHIEGKHNTETDHAEDEYLEVWMDEGIVGFGILLWMMLMVFTVSTRALRELTANLAQRGGRPPPRAYDIAGYLVAFIGMMFHNLFDVSLRFVSSGVYFGLLIGIVINLSRGYALIELHDNGANDPKAKRPWDFLNSEVVLWPLRAAAWASLAYTVVVLWKGFDFVQGDLRAIRYGGEALQWWIAWCCFAPVVLGLALAFARLAYLSRLFVIPVLVALMHFPMIYVWGFFTADVHHNMAIAYSKQGQWPAALENYRLVNKLNPHYMMAFYFKGNVYNDRWNMEKEEHPEWDDPPSVKRDDFERAQDAYERVLAMAPNYVQMHHQLGLLLMKRGQYAKDHGDMDGYQKYYDQALTQFKLYENIDPVFAPNYHRMAQIHMDRQEVDKAIETLKNLIYAPKCRVSENLNKRTWIRETILSYQGYRAVEGSPLPAHLHEDAEGYTALGNAYFIKGEAKEAQMAYRRALELSPGHAMAQRNLSLLHEKVNQALQLQQPPEPKK